MIRARSTLIVGITAMIAAGFGAAITVVVERSSSTTAAAVPGASDSSTYSYYRAMMGRYPTGSMMGGTGTSIGSRAGYRWMMGGATAPGWMRYGTLPSYMMGASTDPGRDAGRLPPGAPVPGRFSGAGDGGQRRQRN